MNPLLDGVDGETGEGLSRGLGREVHPDGRILDMINIQARAPGYTMYILYFVTVTILNAYFVINKRTGQKPPRPTWDSNPESSAKSIPETDALTIRPVGRRDQRHLYPPMGRPLKISVQHLPFSNFCCHYR